MKVTFVALLVSVLFACSKPEDEIVPQNFLTVDQQSLNFNDSVSTLSIGVHAFGPWTLSVTPDTSWLSVSSTSGTGSTTINVSTKTLNTTGADRTATIHIALNDSSVSKDVIVTLGTVNEKLLHVFGGEGNDVFNSIYYENGEYILAGYTESNEGDVNENAGGKDLWIVKVNAAGEKIWHRTYGGSGDDIAKNVNSLFDGTFLISGETSSSDGDISSSLGGKDVWLIRIDGNGDKIWEKTIGGPSDDGITSMGQSSWGGYVFSGVSDGDQWYGVIDNNGDITWQKTFGSTGEDFAGAIYSTMSGYVFSGYGSVKDGDVADKPTSSPDGWVVTTDDAGNVLWKKYISGANEETILSAEYMPNDTYFVVGTTNSPDSFPEFDGTKNIFLASFSLTGDIIYKKILKQSKLDEPLGISMTKFISPVIIGKTLHPGSQESDNNSDAAIWVIDHINGFVSSYATVGANSADAAYALARGPSGEYAFAGSTFSYPDAAGNSQSNSGGWFYIWNYP